MRKLKGINGVSYKVLVIPDMHVRGAGVSGGLDYRSFEAMLDYAKSVKWDHVVQLGDYLDLNQLSRWTKEDLRKASRESLQAEFDEGNRVLDMLQKAVRRKNPDVKIVMSYGNHDQIRLEKYMDKFPIFEGMLEFHKVLNLRERGIKWFDGYTHADEFSIGHCRFIHGDSISKTHAVTMMNDWCNDGSSLIYGHTHDHQVASRKAKGNDVSPIAMSVGCLCELEQDYIKKKPTKWVQGFAVLDFKPDGTFNHNFIRIQDHSFIAPNGKFYKG